MPIVFRDFGTTPFWDPTQFDPAEFGSLAAGGIGAESGATLARDFVSTVEFNVSRIRDVITPTAIFTSQSVDIRVAQEISSVAAVLADAVTTAEWSKTLAGWSPIVPIEWRAALAIGLPDSVEWRSTFTADQINPTDAKLSVAATTSGIPVDLQLTSLILLPTGVEWRTLIARDTTDPVDSVLAARADFLAPIEGVLTFRRDDAAPVQFLPTILRDDQIGIESGLTPVAATVDTAVAVEWSGGIFTDRPTPVEARSSLYRDTVVWSERTGGAASFNDITAPIEFGIGSTTSAAPTSVETTLGVLSEPEIGALADAATVSDLINVAESTLRVLGEDFFFPDAVADRATADDAFAFEWTSGFITADATLSASWQRELITDASWLASWIATISADTLSLVETLTTPVTFHADAELPIDWTMPVLVDVVIGSGNWFERHAVGAELEPDTWESEHE